MVGGEEATEHEPNWADPRKLPLGPDRVEIAPKHLSITQKWASGSEHNVHVLENGDIGVALTYPGRSSQPINPGDHGTVIVSIGVDEDHDEVQYEARWFGEDHTRMEPDELLAQAIEALVACRYAMRKAAQR